MAFPGWQEKVTFLLCRTGGHFYFAATLMDLPALQAGRATFHRAGAVASPGPPRDGA